MRKLTEQVRLVVACSGLWWLVVAVEQKGSEKYRKEEAQYDIMTSTVLRMPANCLLRWQEAGQ